MKNTKTIKQAIAENGVRKNWVAEKMGIQPMSMSRKLKDDRFTISERFFIQSLLNVDLGVKIK